MWGNHDEEEKEVLKREWNDDVIRAELWEKEDDDMPEAFPGCTPHKNY